MEPQLLLLLLHLPRASRTVLMPGSPGSVENQQEDQPQAHQQQAQQDDQWMMKPQ